MWMLWDMKAPSILFVGRPSTRLLVKCVLFFVGNLDAIFVLAPKVSS